MSYQARACDELDMNEITFGQTPFRRTKDIVVHGKNISKAVWYVEVHIGASQPVLIKLPRGQVTQHGIWFQQDCSEIKELCMNLEACIAKAVYKHSMDWFGKQFSEHKIKQCLVSNLRETSGGVVLLSLSSSPIALGLHGTGIVRIANLQFLDNKFTYNILLEEFSNDKVDDAARSDVLEDEYYISD